MGGLQMQPPGHQPPLSAPGVLGASVIQGGLGPYGQNSVAAGPQAADMAARALAAVQANTNSGVPSSGLSAQGLASVVTRPQLGDDLYCSCPMVCVVGTNYGAPHAVPLSIMSLQFEVSCHISQAFVHMQLVCHYPMVSLVCFICFSFQLDFERCVVHLYNVPHQPGLHAHAAGVPLPNGESCDFNYIFYRKLHCVLLAQLFAV